MIKSGPGRFARLFALGAIAAVGLAPAGASDRIVIGVPNWPSAQVTANILAIGLARRFDVATELREQGTLGIFAAIDRGEVHIHPEVWLPNLGSLVDKFAADRGSVRLSPIGVAASQGMCTTRATAEATGLDEISDLTDPTIAGQFDTDGDGVGEMWIGAPTWASTPVEKIRARSYGYDQTMQLLMAQEDAAMAAIDVAVALGTPIVFFCYAPHHIFGLHDVVRLDEPQHDPDTWSVVLPADDPMWLSRSTAASAWPPSHFHIGFATSLSRDRPELAEFLSRIAFTPEDIVSMAYAVEVDGLSPSQAAAHWVERNNDRLMEWTQ